MKMFLGKEEKLMTKDEKLEKILEMSKEIIELMKDNITEHDIDQVYIQTKLSLAALKGIKEGCDK